MSRVFELRNEHRLVGAEFMATQQRYYELQSAVCYVEQELEALRQQLERVENEMRREGG